MWSVREEDMWVPFLDPRHKGKLAHLLQAGPHQPFATLFLLVDLHTSSRPLAIVVAPCVYVTPLNIVNTVRWCGHSC